MNKTQILNVLRFRILFTFLDVTGSGTVSIYKGIGCNRKNTELKQKNTLVLFLFSGLLDESCYLSHFKNRLKYFPNVLLALDPMYFSWWDFFTLQIYSLCTKVLP